MMFLAQYIVGPRSSLITSVHRRTNSRIQGFISGAMLNVYFTYMNFKFGQLVVLGMKSYFEKHI